MIVSFSYHAVERMSQRLNANISLNTKVDISKMFYKVQTYTHDKTGLKVEDWICRDSNNRVVLSIGVDSKCVITVMTQGPKVDALYAKFKAVCK